MCDKLSITFDDYYFEAKRQLFALPKGVEYFEQCLGASPYQRWSKSVVTKIKPLPSVCVQSKKTHFLPKFASIILLFLLFQLFA